MNEEALKEGKPPAVEAAQPVIEIELKEYESERKVTGMKENEIRA